MAERIDATTWSIQGETVTLPVTITSARMAAAVFTTPAAEARRVLAGSPLEPLTIFGRAVTVLMFIHYDEWVLKTYDEVGVGLLVRGPRRSAGPRSPGLHLVDLPVTGAFTREAGQDFWALPKWLMAADLTFGPPARITVRDGETEVMHASIGDGRLRLPFGTRLKLPAWSFLRHGAQAGRLLRGRLPMNLSGIRVGRGAYDVRLGEHPMAAKMTALGMLKRPLLTVSADRMTGSLGSFTATAAPSPPS
ncbi:acetoacetate decarboxylase family protein [Paractinoplanes ferrugineus]|uniref:Acetoacetate decarboxylase n=1 Tax=Paractinoplanes ferrugineus TaxID=113564 RepID=A0A919J2C8_9ACTN|nr:acetoacetate decarboxylase family protein [Actinoplanes ferrugineus]GIE12638.1 acetoacetate decarboxylase [Actinoplanes ferrugineus]